MVAVQGHGGGNIGVRTPSGALEAPLPYLKQVGMLFLAESHASFREQGLGAVRWPARMTPNIHGLIADFEKGPNAPARRFQDRPALKDRDDLRKSLSPRIEKVQVNSQTEVQVGTPVKYAKLMHEGGKKTSRITATVRRNLALWLKTPTGKRWRKRLGFLFQLAAYTSKIYARPFAGLTSRVRGKIVKAGERYFRGGRGGALPQGVTP